MILASAQTKPKRGDIESNLADHYRLIKIAAGSGAELIVFPEMSISGYERENANELSFSGNDGRLSKLQKLADEHRMTIIAGAPIRIKNEIFIGSFVLRPAKAVSVYTKQFLHEGEDEFFASSFEYNPAIQLNNEKMALAICADIDHPEHPANAKKAKSTIYIASIFFSPNGIPNAHTALSKYASEHNMGALMSNYGGDSWGMASGGRSAFWDDTGILIAEMESSGSGLLLVEKKDNKWNVRVIRD
jgi:predicted amidohydrolase